MSTDDDPVFVSVRDSLVGVCLGFDTPDDDGAAIQQLCHRHDLALGKIVWWNNDPFLVGITHDL